MTGVVAAAALAVIFATGAAAQGPPPAAAPRPPIADPESTSVPLTGDQSTGTDPRLTAHFGRLFQDYLDLGGWAERRVDAPSSPTMVASGEYQLPLTPRWVPYAGAGLGIMLRDPGTGADDNALVVSSRVGVTWLVREYFAVDANLFMSWSREEVFVTNGRPDDHDYGLRLRLRMDF
jgi:hypothetical protein